jgi:hypothetical protein
LNGAKIGPKMTRKIDTKTMAPPIGSAIGCLLRCLTTYDELRGSSSQPWIKREVTEINHEI